MPLRCIDTHGQSIQSNLLNESQWAELKRLQGVRKNLRMPCCEQGVVLKTSKLGTNFFAHQRRGGCTTKPESAEHLMLKSLVATAIRNCGWNVATEVRGRSDEGEEWIADVLATRGSKRIAVEIQWSRQSSEETYSRQTRYERSDVRGLWLFKQADYPNDAAVPAMQVSKDDEGRFVVSIPNCRPKVEDGVSYLVEATEQISVPEFIRHALEKRLWFGLYRAQSYVTATLLGAFVKCWKCREWTNVIAEIQISSPSNHHVLEIPLDELPSFPLLMEQLPITGLRDKKVGRIAPRYSKTEGGEYLANGCVSCNALQGKFFMSEIRHRLQPVYSQSILVNREFEQILHTYADLFCRWRLDLPSPTLK
ncbi:TPA: hypothetical protein MXR76_005359 [Pseudomonas aeruginosa]|uniref:competence protein CoiA n=1 Tax=Pseudomonas aeruginosa TaxID=287 RepID=UPI000939E8C6|nr:competence protein CoiA family protein [Pseudomonas aeruginosa]EKF7416650.1 hypothetical protein [Pseudomonas aeruginosa]CAI9794674.1 competence protein CoiA family protein [Pseudomonas aeruginosa]CAI9912063.1 competence protein CoiA family protein [Pseudomonas aeruginosa]HBO1620036.1 hypothetical protein [Pseudomonas aeruginosa]HBO9385189.1 hypothetical protein [Pseudomonas aeruginosa]